MTDLLPDLGGGDGSAARVAAIEDAPYMRGTKARFTIAVAIGVAAVVDFPVVFDKALPSGTDYDVVIGFRGADNGILGNLSGMLKAGTETNTGCTVSIKNSVLVTLGINVRVTVIAVY